MSKKPEPSEEKTPSNIKSYASNAARPLTWASLAATPITPAQRQANLQKEALRKAEAASLALNTRAESLAQEIESVIISEKGGTSSAYPGDLQYTVSDKWTTSEASLALTKWKNNLNAQTPGSDVLLNMHMLGPTLKTTGGRNWYQFNFIRKRTSAETNRYNVHVDQK